MNTLARNVWKINKNVQLYCEMGKKKQAPARAIFVQGSLYRACGEVVRTLCIEP